MDKTAPVIMIIDDNPHDQDIFRRFLQRDKKEQYSFVMADTGEKGLEHYETERLDCILLDYNLPDIDGLELLEKMSGPDAPPKTPIIFLTGQGDETIAVEAMKLGASDYLIKDKVNSDILLRSVHYSISKKLNERTQQEQLIFLETLIDTIPNPLFFIDRSGTYKGCNKAFENFVRKPREEIIGKSDYDLLPPEFTKKFRGLDQQLLRTPGIESFEETVYFPDEKPRYVLVNKASYTNFAGEVDGLVGVIIDITERKKAEEEVTRLALYDDLTKLPNRRLFFERLSQSFSRAKRNKTYVAVMYIDLNGFKPINDTFGHEAGDEVLHQIGKRISRTIRKMDTGARIGGDEFALILPDLPKVEGAETVAKKIARAIHRPITYQDHELTVTASIGIGIYPEDGSKTDEIVNRADEAMYSAKQNGKKSDEYNIVRYSSEKRGPHEQ